MMVHKWGEIGNVWFINVHKSESMEVNICEYMWIWVWDGLGLLRNGAQLMVMILNHWIFGYHIFGQTDTYEPQTPSSKCILAVKWQSCGSYTDTGFTTYTVIDLIFLFNNCIQRAHLNVLITIFCILGVAVYRECNANWFDKSWYDHEAAYTLQELLPLISTESTATHATICRLILPHLATCTNRSPCIQVTKHRCLQKALHVLCKS